MHYASTHSLKPKPKYVKLSDINDEVNFDNKNSPSSPPPPPSQLRATNTASIHEKAQLIINSLVVAPTNANTLSMDKNMEYAHKETIAGLRQYGKPLGASSTQNVAYARTSRPKPTLNHWVIYHKTMQINIDCLVEVKLVVRASEDQELVINKKWTNNQVTAQFTSWFLDAFAWYKENIHLYITESKQVSSTALYKHEHPNSTKVVKYSLKPKIGCDSQQLFISFTVQISEELVLWWKDLEVLDADSPILNWDFLTNNKKHEIVEMSSNSSDAEEYHGKGKGKALPPPQKRHRLNNATPPVPTAAPATAPSTPTHAPTIHPAPLWESGDLSAIFGSSLIIHTPSPKFLGGPTVEVPEEENFNFLL
ncbi:hypothetical protein P691DRAFT_789933 [Macrolepiota fuliginosa MF-IS2]|uniref:Uncharacterized protein n=1 Tax=Macrolepiota fuliginosa MF-IS2 TaxID=1400762 RepID=A0A9P6BY05_9AGAR|nr:hypothetical protein P691DRAFT_789933 [Macrolepiota fuliginosa MF-IS2]